jgi:hypothetical protein
VPSSSSSAPCAPPLPPTVPAAAPTAAAPTAAAPTAAAPTAAAPTAAALSAAVSASGEECDDALLCPITLDIMTDPVSVMRLECDETSHRTHHAPTTIHHTHHVPTIPTIHPPYTHCTHHTHHTLTIHPVHSPYPPCTHCTHHTHPTPTALTIHHTHPTPHTRSLLLTVTPTRGVLSQTGSAVVAGMTPARPRRTPSSLTGPSSRTMR